MTPVAEPGRPVVIVEQTGRVEVVSPASRHDAVRIDWRAAVEVTWGFAFPLWRFTAVHVDRPEVDATEALVEAFPVFAEFARLDGCDSSGVPVEGFVDASEAFSELAGPYRDVTRLARVFRCDYEDAAELCRLVSPEVATGLTVWVAGQSGRWRQASNEALLKLSHVDLPGSLTHPSHK